MRPAQLAALFLLLATVACAVPARGAATPGAENGTESPVRAVLATQGAEQGADGVSARSVVIQATPEPTAIPTQDPLIAQLAADSKAANERADAALKLVNDQNERIAQAYRDAATANEQTAKWNAAQAVTELETQKELTQRQIHENEHVLLLVQLAEAEALKKEADARMLAVLAFVALCVAGALVLARILWLNPPVRETNAEPGEWKQTAPNQIVRVGSSSDKSVQVSDAALERYLEYAMRGSMLGVNNAISALKNIVDKADVETLTDYVTDNGYSSPTKLPRGGTTNVLNASGEQWARDELERIHNHPAPLSDVPETTPSTRHERAETHVLAEGEVLSDDFGITDAADFGTALAAANKPAADEPRKEQDE